MLVEKWQTSFANGIDAEINCRGDVKFMIRETISAWRYGSVAKKSFDGRRLDASIASNRSMESHAVFLK